MRVSVLDPQTGKHTTLTVIGVLSDSAPAGMAGIWTSQATLTPIFGDRVLPTTYLFKLKPGVDPTATAKKLQTAFMANGLQADSMKKLLNEAIAASLVFDRLLEGFLGLGLIVGVAALGVVTARAVVERRQQIGVLRAIGYQRRMVQASLLIESSFIALTAILVGTVLGLIVAYNVIHSSAATRCRLGDEPAASPFPGSPSASSSSPSTSSRSRPRSSPPATPRASTQPKHSATSRPPTGD